MRKPFSFLHYVSCFLFLPFGNSYAQNEILRNNKIYYYTQIMASLGLGDAKTVLYQCK